MGRVDEERKIRDERRVKIEGRRKGRRKEGKEARKRRI